MKRTLHEDLCAFMVFHSILLRMRNFSDKSCRENQNTFCVQWLFFLSKIEPFMRKCGKIWYSQTGHRWQYGACALHAGYLRLQTHTHSQYVLLIIFSTTIILDRSHLIVAYIHTLPFSFNTNKIHCLRIYIHINLDVYVLLFHNWTIKTFFF